MSNALNKVILSLLVLLLSSTVCAYDQLNATGKHFYNGCLVINDQGEQELIVGNALASHSALINKFSKTPKQVLWAGELEVVDGNVTRVNETAGIIKEKPELCKDLDQPGTGIKNLQDFLDGMGSSLKELHFTKSDYIKYDENDEHLDPVLKYITYFRHDISRDLRSVINAVLDPEREDDGVKAAKDIITAYTAIMSVYSKELDTQEWESIKPYFEQIALGQIPTDEEDRLEYKKKYNDLHMSFCDSRHEITQRAEKDYIRYTIAPEKEKVVTTETKSKFSDEPTKSLLLIDYGSLTLDERKEVNGLLMKLLAFADDEKVKSYTRAVLYNRWNDLTMSQQGELRGIKLPSVISPTVVYSFSEDKFVENAKEFLAGSTKTADLDKYKDLATNDLAKLCVTKMVKILNSWWVLKEVRAVYFFNSDQVKILIAPSGLLDYFYYKAVLKEQGQRTTDVMVLEILRGLSEYASVSSRYANGYINRSIDIKSFVQKEKQKDPKLDELLKDRENFSRTKNLEYIESNFKE